MLRTAVNVTEAEQKQLSLPAGDYQLTVGERGTYLITGGWGALGLKAACWLAEQGHGT